MEEIIDIKSLFKYFWDRRKIMLYIIGGVFLFANIMFFILTRPLYSNVAKVRISAEATDNRVTSYNDFLKSDSIVNAAIANSNINANVSKVKKNLSINANNGSKIYTITLNYRNKIQGKTLCSSILSEFIDKIKSYDGNSATIYDGVSTSNWPINFNLVKKEFIYVVIGCMLAFGYVFVLYYFDKKIKSESELDKYNILGTILNSKKDNYKNNISLIKTKIKLSNLGQVIFMNTAKNINCKNDVLSLVKEFSKDSKVIFIDTNIRNKSKNLGYSDLLSDYKEDISKFINIDGEFDTMESGTNNNEVEVLLSSKNNEKLISSLKKKYDYIILYNYDVVDYSDALILSKLCDSNYMLVEINQTNKDDFEKSLDAYKQVNSEVNGVIIIDKE